jgi:hypothetical protein
MIKKFAANVALERRRIVLVDVDHVITDAFWRDPMLLERDWDAYHMASVDDKPDKDIRLLLESLSVFGNLWIVGLTARPEKWRKMTMDYMLKHDVPMNELLMRPNDCYDPSPKVKVDLINKHYADQMEEIMFVIEDKEDTVIALKGLNLNVLHYHMKRR